MLKIKSPTPGVLPDYFPASFHDQALYLEGSEVPRCPQVFYDAIELHTPRKNVAAKPNLGGGQAGPPVVVDHLPRPRHFKPLGIAAVLPASLSHAPFAAAVSALASLAHRGGTPVALGADLSVVARLSGGSAAASPNPWAVDAHAVAAGFFRRRGAAAKSAHHVPVVVRDTLPTVGTTTGIMGFADQTPQGPMFNATYALAEKAYAQFIRGDERAPIWDPHAATLADDASTAECTAHALFSLTGSQPAVRTVRGEVRESTRAALLLHVMRAANDPAQATVLILHGRAPSADPKDHGDDGDDAASPDLGATAVPSLRLGEHPFVVGMPLAVLQTAADSLALHDPLRNNASFYNHPTVEQLRRNEQALTANFYLNDDAAAQEQEAVDFPQRFAQTVPDFRHLLPLSYADLKGLDYTAVTVRPVPRKAAKHQALAALESLPTLLRRAQQVAGLSHDAKQGLLRLLGASRWSVDTTGPEPVATLLHRGRSLLSVTQHDASRMFRTATCETPRPLIEHLVDLPEAAPEA